MPIHFADPYSPWQKGAVEHANKLIRQYLPKRTDFTNYSYNDMMKIPERLNHRPRKNLTSLHLMNCSIKNYLKLHLIVESTKLKNDMKVDFNKKCSFAIITIFLLNTCVVSSTKAQEKVTFSPFYSDFPILTDSLPSGWSSFSPFIQLCVEVVFPPHVSLSELQDFSFQNPPMSSDILWSLMPVTLKYGDLTFENVTLNDWNFPSMNDLIRAELERGDQQFTLNYHHYSPISGILVNDNNVNSFCYIYHKGWESIIPTSIDSTDSIEVVFNVNPSLFYLVTENNDIDVNNNSIILAPGEPIPTFGLFYRPVYKELKSQYRGIDLHILEGDIKLQEELWYKLTSRLTAPVDSIVSDANEEVNTLQRLKKSLDAIAQVLTLDPEKHPRIDIVKTGLLYNVRFGQKGSETRQIASFSFNTDGFILMDQEMFNTQTLIHELLHKFIPHKEVDNGSNIKTSFFNESLIEYLAKYLFGQYIAHKNCFLDEEKILDSTRLEKARMAVLQNETVSIGPEDEEGDSMDTAEVYYDILPYLVHRITTNSQQDEQVFAQAICDYLVHTPDSEFSLKSFFNYLENKGFSSYSMKEIQLILAD